jgi:hypothetical protein
LASNSEHGGYIRGYAATALPAAGPVDTGATRDAIINNLIHLHDVAGQQVCALSAGSGSYWTQASPSTSTFQLLDDLPPIRFFVRARPARSFLIVHRVRVSISVAGTATFRIALQNLSEAGREPFYSSAASTPFACEFTTTNTTGENLNPTSLYLPASYVPALARAYPSLRGDGSLGSASGFEVQMSIWAKSSAGAPRLHGWMAREHIGS